MAKALNFAKRRQLNHVEWGTPTHLISFQNMPDDDDIPEIAAPPVAVEETNRLFRLVPVGNDMLQVNRPMFLVPADTEDQARRIATIADPMGRDWRDTVRFAAESTETPERHVVGDVIFRSMPNPALGAKRPGKT